MGIGVKITCVYLLFLIRSSKGKGNRMKPHRLVIVVIIFVAAVAVCLIFSAKWFCQGYEHQFFSGLLGSILATVFAAFLVWVAWEELSKLGRTSSADFIHRLDDDFFTRETRTLFSLIDCKVLEFCPNAEMKPSEDIESEPYFEVNQNKLDKTKLPEDLKHRLSKKKYYSAWEVDDMLLGHFEKIGILEKRGIVDFQTVYEIFGYYITTVWNNDHIKKYIINQRSGEETARIDTLIYFRFQYIARKCIEYADLHPGLCMLWWKIKRHFREPKIERFPSITTPCDT